MKRKRARALGIPFDGKPGRHNAITDVPGVTVGYTTLDNDARRIHTGVTAIWPRGKRDLTPVFAACVSLNGNGELTGTALVEESGILEGPIALTGTTSVGVVHDAIQRYLVAHRPRVGLPRHTDYGTLPVVGETWDGELNDIMGFHVTAAHVAAALDGAASGPLAEGNVGGGTGMTLFDHKGGTGTASRVIGRDRVGVLAQCNFGSRDQLVVAGVPVGRLLRVRRRRRRAGSIIVVIATTAPLLPHQLKRIARRATHGLARVGSISESTSGDLFVAFTTARAEAIRPSFTVHGRIDDAFEAVVQATEEAIINALVAAETMAGARATYPAIDIPQLLQILRRHRRLRRA